MIDVVTLPVSAVQGATIATGLPHSAHFVAVRARWCADSRRWLADLRFAEPPAEPDLKKDGWRFREIDDVPSGLDRVTLRVHYQCWRDRNGRRHSSPVPDMLGGTPIPGATRGRRTGVMGYTSALADHCWEAQREFGLPPWRAAACAGDTDRYRMLRRQAARHDLPGYQQAENHALLRPAHLPDTLGIDEIHLGGTYWTVLVDNMPDSARTDGQRIIGLSLGREPDALQPMLREVATWYREEHAAGHRQRAQPELVAMDMWRDFKEAVRHDTAFGDDQFIAVDRFHFQRHIGTALKKATTLAIDGLSPDVGKAVLACTGATASRHTCTCGQPERCRQYRRAATLDGHLQTIWTLSGNEGSETFRVTWTGLWRHWPDLATKEDAYSKVNWLLSEWEREISQMIAARGEGPLVTNSRAERANRTLRRTLRRMGVADPLSVEEDLFEWLHSPPPDTTPVDVHIPATALTCPTCRGSVDLPARVPHVPVLHLPRGLRPVVLRIPVRVRCRNCGLQPCPPPPSGMTDALNSWLHDPRQLALSQAALQRLTGADAKVLARIRNEELRPEHAPRDQRGRDTVVYSEVSTARRTWLLLSTPDGRIVDLKAEPRGEAATRRRRVARRAQEMLWANQPISGYLQVQLTTQYAELNDTLKDVPWWGKTRRKNRRPFTLAPYTRAGLHVTFARKARRLPEDDPLRGTVLREAAELRTTLAAPGDKHKELDRMYRRRELVPLPRHQAGEPAGRVLQRQAWAAWHKWQWALNAGAVFAPVASGQRPHLIRRVRELLENSPALAVERQRVRILRTLNVQQIDVGVNKEAESQ